MAYAAVVSLQHTIIHLSKCCEIQIVQNSSPQMIKVLAEEVDSLAKVLRGWDSNTRRFSISKRLKAVDAQIRDAVFKLEDVLESHLLHHFLSQSQIHQHPLLFSMDIEELKPDIDSSIQAVNNLKAEYICELTNHLPEEEEEEEEGEDDDAVVKMFGLSNQLLLEIKDRLFKTGYSFIPLALWGMAGIGKTTLARKVFQDPLVSSHYEGCRAFVKVGPEYQLKDVYLDILKQVHPDSISDEMIKLMEGDHQEELVADLKRKVNDCLKDQKYLIVLDDVWDYEMLDLDCFQEKDDESGILLTTRLRSVVEEMNYWTMPFLDKEKSWDMLCAKLFGEDSSSSCPPQLEKAGKKIAKNCEGLPLTIVKVANILSKQEMTLEHWNKVAANKQHSVYKEAYAQMHKVLLPSYYCLPQYLRISFLYMGLFPQNYEIPCTKLHMLWMAEGFIMQSEKSSVNEYYFKELFSNSVLIAHNRSFNGECKIVGLHSSFWYLCKKEAGKSKFFHSFTTLDDCVAQGIETQRRLCIYNPVLFAIKDAYDSMASVSAARSLLCTGAYHPYPVPVCFGLRLLRVLDALTIHFYEFPMEVLKLIHLTYFALTCDGDLPSSISKLWNLMYLIVDRTMSIKSSDGVPAYLPVEIWDMKNLEHLQVMGSDLPEPPEGSLMTLFKLLDVSPHSCTKTILEGLPYLRKLGIRIELSPDAAVHQPLGCFDHIRHMSNLISFKCVVVNPRIMFEVAMRPPVPLPIFPEYIEKLTLSGTGYPWLEMSKMSSLPNLRVLKLVSYAFRGPKWDVQDNEFPNLRVLEIEETDLVQWTIKDDYHIHHLGWLIIKHCYNLKEMPMDFTETLEKIEVVDCNPLILSSANKIKEDWDRTYSQSHYRVLDLDVHSSWDDEK